MRNILLVVGAAGLVGIFSACGGSSDHAGVPNDPGSSSGKGTGGSKPATNGGKNSGGSDSVGGAGGADDSTNTDPLGPTVIITSPEELTDPDQDGVLSGSDVTATCNAVQSRAVGAGKVNAASVELAILDAKGKVLDKKPGVPTVIANEYSAKFNLTAVPAGVVSFTCTAADVNMHQGMARLATLLDKGPLVTIIGPKANSAHPLSEPLDIEFTVEAAPLSNKDANAEIDVDSVKLSLVGQPIDLADAMDKPGHYRLQVDLADPKLFNPVPSGPVPLVVEASNQRTPDPVTATTAEDVVVDGAGPTIQIVNPGDKAVVGGKVKLSFNVTDTVSGVDQNSVTVSLNMDNHEFDATLDSWSVVNGLYTFEFDSRQAQGSKVQITVNVGASDKVGNVSTGASELLFLDNYPPYIDLDPLNIRTETDGKCSRSFDPVGNAAKNDLDSAERAGIFRAIVWDETNHIDEVPYKHPANTNPESVRLYLQSDNSTPLLVDKDDDGICDDVAQVDSMDSISLSPVPRDGVPWNLKDDDTAPATASIGCTTEVGTAPGRLCLNKDSDMWQVIQDDYTGQPVVYARSPTPSGAECTGVSWEFGTFVDADGWVCFATRAVDNVGNVGVSRPIRICVDDPDRDGTPPCATQSLAPPSCTDGCTPQPRWKGYFEDGTVLWK
jgi:hypothetical protein